MATSAANKRLVKSKSGLKFASLGTKGKSPFELPEPLWVPDKSTPSCMKCETKFDFMNRRHHCRRCGHCFCSSCCKSKVPLPRMCFVDPVLLCKDCTTITRKENEFFDKYLKILLNGASFCLEDQVCSQVDGGASSFASDGEKIFCKLSPDHKCLVIDSSGIAVDPIELSSMQGVKVLTESTPYGQGVGGQACGLVLRYRDSHGEFKALRITASTDSRDLRKASQLWLVSMHKAAKLLYGDVQTPTSPSAPDTAS